MRIRLQLIKKERLLFAGVYDVVDADGFGKACADVWCRVREDQLTSESSIGALMDHLNCGVLDLLDGAQIAVERA
jgi:hypothetical protein